MRKKLLLFVAATLLATNAHAQSTSEMTGMEHHDHHHAAEGAKTLGHVSFPTSCSAQSQAPMERGIAGL